jgi:hypothetical protein
MLDIFKEISEKSHGLLLTPQQLNTLYSQIKQDGAEYPDARVSKHAGGIAVTLHDNFYVQRHIEFWDMINTVTQHVVAPNGDIHTRDHSFNNANQIAEGQEMKIYPLPKKYQTYQQYTETDIKALEAAAETPKAKSDIIWIRTQKQIGQPPFYTPAGNPLVILDDKISLTVKNLMPQINLRSWLPNEFLDFERAFVDDTWCLRIIPFQNTVIQILQRGDSDIYIYQARYDPQFSKLTKNFALIDIIQKPDIADRDFKNIIVQMLKDDSDNPLSVTAEQTAIEKFAKMTLNNHFGAQDSFYLKKLIQRTGLNPKRFARQP